MAGQIHGPNSEAWATASVERTVVVVFHTLAGATHLLDAIELIEHDHRVQVLFTQAPDLFSSGVARFLRRLDAVVIPWADVLDGEFDLVLASDCAELHRLRTPVLLLAHGVMNNKLAPPALGGPASGLVVGLAAPWLTWYGRLVPTTVALSNGTLREVLARQCPQALAIARVVGDLCLDRLVVSRRRRVAYRRALGVPDNRTLVALSSTWGTESMFATSRELLAALVAQLPRSDYAVIATLHPALWHGHGPRQVLAWLSENRRCGLRVVEPLGWRAVAAAADIVIGDHGSATIYAAAAGVPVARVGAAAGSVRCGSAVAELAAATPVLDPHHPLPTQFENARSRFQPDTAAAVAARTTSRPGRAASLLRREMYRLLRLPEPETAATTSPVPTVRTVGRWGR